MSREEPRPSADRADQVQAVWKRFREGRLYVQVVLSVVLVGVSLLVAVAPGAPVTRARTALRWVAHHDYDFAGQAARANGWAHSRGGWGVAAAGLWQSGQDRVQGWIKRAGASLPGAAPADGTAPRNAAGPAASTAAPAPTAAAAPTAPPPVPAAAGAPPGSSAWGLPVANATVLYGYGWLPRAVSDKLHEGIDFAAPVATPVVAVSDGSITRITADPQLGFVIEARHGALTVLYAQVESIRVQPGEPVRRGQVLAVVGKPAGAEKALPPHLHFAVRPAGKEAPVDPAHYLGLGGDKH